MLQIGIAHSCSVTLGSSFLPILPSLLLLACFLASLLPCFLTSLLPCFLASLLPCFLACLLACLLACVRACVLACLRACVLACLRACVLACLRACVLACLRACALARLRACVLACLRACLRAYLFACLLAYLRACLLACLRACARACMHACLLACCCLTASALRASGEEETMAPPHTREYGPPLSPYLCLSLSLFCYVHLHGLGGIQKHHRVIGLGFRCFHVEVSRGPTPQRSQWKKEGQGWVWGNHQFRTDGSLN